ncbi:TadE/TadG family type IV pilus assembly protein [Bremerella sp. JC770]|uniref:TadE/TadG family type IV pilus assembly protein n=1 Tax=Bremerella sp. JC770 TaxID=3232137 RepID=UPI003459BF6B
MNTQRKGQSLVEFALVALVLYLLLGAIFTFGHALYVAQQVQMSADLLAREVSRRPASIQATHLAEGLEMIDTQEVKDGVDPTRQFKRQVFDQDYLCVSLDSDSEKLPISKPSDLTLREWIDRDWPLVNKQLSTVMITDSEQSEFKFPGLADRGDDDGTRRYQIPLFFNADMNTDDHWIDVVEEIDFDETEYDKEDATTFGPFSFEHPSQGVVALRINYPISSTFLSEDMLGADNLSSERPYRRIVSGQAIYRREVFTP